MKKKYIPGLVSADILGAFAITEPQAASDTMAIKSTTEDKGDHWLVNGTKTEKSPGETGNGAKIVFGSLSQSRISAAVGGIELA